MRTIKFRLWNNKTKSWIHGPNKESCLDGVNLLGETILFGELLGGVGIEDLNEIETLQFTGAKDSDGKEIFEGDIIKLPDNNIGKVVYSENSTAFLVVTDKVTHANYPVIIEQDGINKNKVIGNIFENKELLES